MIMVNKLINSGILSLKLTLKKHRVGMYKINYHNLNLAGENL